MLRNLQAFAPLMKCRLSASRLASITSISPNSSHTPRMSGEVHREGLAADQVGAGLHAVEGTILVGTRSDHVSLATSVLP